MQQKNTFVFVVVSFLILIGWFAVQTWLHPAKPKPPEAPPATKKQEEKKEPEQKLTPPSSLPNRGLATPAAKLIPLGDEGSPDFKLYAKLDPRGAGIRSLTLTDFEESDDSGRPLHGQKLELIPDEKNAEVPSNVLYHYEGEGERYPVDTLGNEDWLLDAEHTLRTPIEQTVSFYTDKLQGLRITKTFTLKAGDYHISLAVKVARRLPSKAALAVIQVLGQPSVWSYLGRNLGISSGLRSEPTSFQYQLSSGHGLPIEGKWYTGIFRNALIGRRDASHELWRDLQDLHSISARLGGEEVDRNDKEGAIKYAGVAVQFFASLLVVDEEQEAGIKPDFLIRARPLMETLAVRGRLAKSLARSFELISSDKQTPYLFYLPNVRANPEVNAKLRECDAGEEVVVRYRIEEAGLVASQILRGQEAKKLFFNDISMRAVSEEFKVTADKPVVHKYLLYNGPTKVRLLHGMGVAPEKVDFYEEKLQLDTLTDYPSSGWPGKFASFIGWSRLLIKCTNLMHWIFGLLHSYVMPWSYGLCIIMLTVLVRGLMFPLSRKQAMTTLRMQQLAPELKKMQEKFKGDRQAMGMAQMELYRRHGVNPFGTCWLLLLQMPIFLGLYYALQESIQFRLAGFLWIENLAAPDMLLSWSSSIPWISRPEDYGWILYLGPFLNIMPIIAVSLMVVQQKMTMPPPTDEQQEMQQKMMKYMMIFMGFMFYKMASGLCVYFVATTLWGFAERRLLPKKKSDGTPETASDRKLGFFQRMLQRLDEQKKLQLGTAGSAGPGAAVPTALSPADKRKKRKQSRERSSEAGDESSEKPASWMAGLRAWWAEVLRKAEKK